MNRNGLVLWEGPSALTGAPIVVIATGLKRKSANAKIGADTVQVWYLPRDVAPNVAVKTGDDEAVCGDRDQGGSTSDRCEDRNTRVQDEEGGETEGDERSRCVIPRNESHQPAQEAGEHELFARDAA